MNASRAGEGAARFVPEGADLDELRRAAASCRGCDLHEAATQTVFGEGDPHARLVLVGEQPGDREDREGHPFVGPAGRLLGRALEEAGIERDQSYVTNAVKHFRFAQEERGKRRLHKPPTRTQIVACRPWLTAELQVLEPEVLVCLGATAGKAVLGPSFKLTDQRGTILQSPFARSADAEPANSADTPDHVVVATIHPSAALRARDRDEMYAGLVADLRVAAAALD